MNKLTIYVSLAVILLLVAYLLVGVISSQVEHPKYEVIKSEGKIEIREYAPQLVAQVSVNQPREEAINAGFRILADYIFGNNTAASKISMTAPVQQNQRSQISMTAPVQAKAAEDGWLVEFIMPSEYSMDTLPKPNNAKVQIIERPSYKTVVVRFSGFSSERNLSKHLAILDAYIEKEAITVEGQPVYAFYNPPWTAPFLRRTEIYYYLR